MSREQEIQAAIVVFPDAIGMASPELNSAIEMACHRLNEFVDYVGTLDPKLERHEATIVAAALIESLPELFRENPEIIASIQADCQAIRRHRR